MKAKWFIVLLNVLSFHLLLWQYCPTTVSSGLCVCVSVEDAYSCMLVFIASWQNIGHGGAAAGWHVLTWKTPKSITLQWHSIIYLSVSSSCFLTIHISSVTVNIDIFRMLSSVCLSCSFHASCWCVFFVYLFFCFLFYLDWLLCHISFLLFVSLSVLWGSDKINFFFSLLN